LAIFAVAAALAWQAWVAPGLTRWLQPPLGAPAAIGLVFAVSALAGGAALYALLRPRAPLSGDADADADAEPERGIDPGYFEQLLLALAHAVPIGVLVLRDGRIATANSLAVQQLQLDPFNWAGRSPTDLFVDPSTADTVLTGAPPLLSSVMLRRANGERFRAGMGVHELSLDHGRFRVLLFDDFTESDRLDARLQQQNEQLLAVAGRLITAQEDERRMLSRELHDDIGQSITAIKLGAASLADDDPSRQEIVDEIVTIADQTVAKLRNLSMLLRPPQLDALGLEAAVRWQAQTLFRGAKPELQLSFIPLPTRPEPAVELACFRIVQEALTNVLRYSGATQVQVALAPDGDMLAFTVSDNGRGFMLGDASGLGLVIMRERAQLLGGRLQIETAPGQGTAVRARLPMTASATHKDAHRPGEA
jgi:signal transduction histidine kinase